MTDEKVWKKKSIFFRLSYLKDNLLRHNLDVMHIEKNVMDNILGTLLGIKGKTKDNLVARKDLEEMGLRMGKLIFPQLVTRCLLKIKLIF